MKRSSAALMLAWSMSFGAGCTSANEGGADGAAVVADGRSEAATSCADANTRLIQASNYDQSCTIDTDCRLIAEGNACAPCAFNCANAAIRAGALTKYNSDVANTPATAAAFNGQTCASGCGAEFGPCCRGGKCQMGAECSSPASAAGSSCDAAGGTCVLGGALCAKQAASSAQDCNPPPVNPGGAFCCLELQDGGGIPSGNDGGE